MTVDTEVGSTITWIIGVGLFSFDPLQYFDRTGVACFNITTEA
jgi:hypothetical protein